jgi:hypothetical protein
MLANRPTARTRRPIGPLPVIAPADLVWKSIWPGRLTSIIGCVMFSSVFIICALEISSLVKSTDTTFYGSTSSTGAGFWCGLFIFIAALLIFLMSKLYENIYLKSIHFFRIDIVHHIRVWATITFIATFIAAGFSAVLIGLDAAAVAYRASAISYLGKTKSLATQLAFGGLEFILCIIFMIIYIVVAIKATIRIRRLQPKVVHKDLIQPV